MKFLGLNFTILTFALFLILIPASVFAEEVTSLAQLAGCSGPDCSMCNVVNIANGLIKWLIGILFVIFAVLLAKAGFGLVTSGGNHHAVDEAKNTFTNAIIGFIIILSAWLVVDTIMRGLVGREGSEGKVVGSGNVSGWLFWSEVQCYTQNTPNKVDPYTHDEFDAADAISPPDPISTGLPGGGGLIGPKNAKIVQYAFQMKDKGCQYSQPKRNNCSGNPGYTDCSNLVEISYRAAGCSSPGGTTATQYPKAEKIGSVSSLQPGDALVYRNGDSGHVVICQNAGCSQVIHAKGRAYGIVTGNGSSYYNMSNIRVIRASRYCGT